MDKKINKKELIRKIKPYLKDYNNGHCFGATTIFNNDGTSETKLQNGKTFEKQKIASIKQTEARIKMCNIVTELCKEDITIAFGTYNDIYFINKNKKIILGINCIGDEIKEKRAYS